MKNSLCIGSDRLTPSKVVKKTPKCGQGCCETIPSGEFLTQNSCELKVAPSAASDDSADAEMSIRSVALLPDLLSLLVFSRVKRRPIANITEQHCTVDAVVLRILLHATGVIMNPLSYFMLFETIIEAFW